MKNYLMFALLIGATASMAFGQFGVVVDPAKVDVACPDDECHVAPVFMGEGGFVGELADGFDMANFVVTCGNTTASGSAAGDGGGVVRQLFSMANGLACHDDDGSIQIHGLADGGWYWINDDMNSAVSPLIAKDALMGDEVMPTDPGGVTLMASDYGTYVKSGDRVGILPHFVPTAPADPPPPVVEPEAPTVCMPVHGQPYGVGNIYWSDTTGCMLGDGGTKIVITGPSNSVGLRSRVTDGMVYRPAVGEPVTVSFSLWGNGTGHISTETGSPAALKGWDMKFAPGHTPQPFVASFRVDLLDSPTGSLATAGITHTTADIVEAVMTHKPGEDGDTAVDGIQPSATANVGATPGIDNGWGYGFGSLSEEVVYCKQKTSMDEDDDTNTLLHFAGTAGEPVMVDPDGNDNPGDAQLGHSATWADQETFRESWNGMAASDEQLATHKRGELVLPMVVCDSTETGKITGVDGIRIAVSPTYCGSGNNHTVNLRIRAVQGPTRSLNPDVVPRFSSAGKVNRVDQAAITTLSVMCPPR